MGEEDFLKSMRLFLMEIKTAGSCSCLIPCYHGIGLRPYI